MVRWYLLNPVEVSSIVIGLLVRLKDVLGLREVNLDTRVKGCQTFVQSVLHIVSPKRAGLV